jgi:O-antigen/teichoic acid export membrane protein
MPEETLKRKTAKGLFWGGINNGIQQLLGVIFGIVLARILNAEDYGVVGMLAIFTGIAGAIINSGFSVALTNKLNATHKDYNAVFWFTVFAGLILYFTLFFAAPLIARFYHREELKSLSRVVFISFFFSGVSTVSFTVMFKQLMVKQQAIIDIISFSVAGVVGVLLALNGKAYWALAVQSVVYICLGSILRYIISPWRPTLNINFSPLKEMFSFSSKMFLTSIFQQIQGNFFSVLLGKFYDATQLGYYSQGYKWMGMGSQLISGMINSVAQPVIVQAGNERERQTRIFRKMVRFAAFVSFPAFVGLAFAGKEFILITIGAKWLPSVIYLQIACAMGLITPFVTLYIQVIISHGKSNVYLWGIVATGILQVLILLVMYPLGIINMLAGYIAVYFISLFFWHYHGKRLVDITIISFIKDSGPYLLAIGISVLIALFCTSGIENLYLLLASKIVLTAIIYISLLWLLNSTILKEIVLLLKEKITL